MIVKTIKEWTTLKGHKALAVINETGRINGYVGVPETSILFGMDYCTVENTPKIEHLNEEGLRYYKAIEGVNEISVHGGLTYADKGSNDFLKSGFWFFGFDTRHYEDLPSQETAFKYFTKITEQMVVSNYFKNCQDLEVGEGTYKTLEFVIEHCESLSEQLKEIENSCSKE